MGYGPGNPPPEFDLPEIPADEYSGIELRVIALKAAAEATDAESVMPHHRVLTAAQAYLEWLRKDEA